MASAIVYENVAEGADLATGELFEGKNFWVAQRVPHRTALLGVIKANGGSIVQLEKLADWMIADHFRKKCPAGSISYDFVHKSVAKGEILDPNDFPAGPRIGTVRDAGSMSRPAKGIRAPFTSEEDRILYKWAKDAQSRGAAVSGNKLYMALEEKVLRHVQIMCRTVLTEHSIHSTHGSHGAIATLKNSSTCLPQRSIYPTMPRHLLLQTTRLGSLSHL